MITVAPLAIAPLATKFSTPDSIPLKFDPSPLNDVAVTTPTALIPPAVTFNPVLAVIIPTESTLVTSSYVKVPPIAIFSADKVLVEALNNKSPLVAAAVIVPDV